jgi:hypothetical protein
LTELPLLIGSALGAVLIVVLLSHQATVAAGQISLQRALLRIADTLVDHGGRFDRIEAAMATLPIMDARIDDLAQSQQRIEQALAAISARLP